jgi:hypothetical protein
MSLTVTVACKIPNGFIMQLERRESTIEPSPAGGRKIEVGRKIGEPIKLNGFATPLTGAPPEHQIVGGFGLTHGVPKDFWDKWLDQFGELDVVKQGLIFAHEKRENVEAEAREKKGLRSNMEPLDPEGRNADKSFKDPRMLRGIQRAEEQS